MASNHKCSNTATIPLVMSIETFNQLMGSGDSDNKSVNTQYEPAFGTNLRDAARILRERKKRG